METGVRPKDYCQNHGDNPDAGPALLPGDLYIYDRPVGGLEWAWHETFFGAAGLSSKDQGAIRKAEAKLQCTK